MMMTAAAGLVMALSAVATEPAGASAADKGGKVAWKTDPEAAFKDARKMGAGMMLYFTSDG